MPLPKTLKCIFCDQVSMHSRSRDTFFSNRMCIGEAVGRIFKDSVGQGKRGERDGTIEKHGKWDTHHHPLFRPLSTVSLGGLGSFYRMWIFLLMFDTHTHTAYAPAGYNNKKKTITCKQCTAKQTVTLTCMTCTKTKPLEQFARVCIAYDRGGDGVLIFIVEPTPPQ